VTTCQSLRLQLPGHRVSIFQSAKERLGRNFPVCLYVYNYFEEIRNGRKFPMKIPLYIVPILFSFLWDNSVLAVEYKPQAAEVVAVVDGDTFWLRFPDSDEDSNIEHVANLIGVDAPGVGEVECEAENVTSIAQRLLLGKTVWVEWDSQDKRTNDGRLLVYVSHIDDHTADLNALYIEQGWGWVPRKFPADRKERYLRLEEQARTMGKGIWGGSCAPNI